MENFNALSLWIFVAIFAFTWGSTNVSLTKAPIKDNPDGCLCEKFTCECCAHLDIPQISINDSGCISLAYDPKDYGIAFIFTIDDVVLINETISARNPPPICLPVPVIEDFIDICIHFTDLNISNTRFHGCVQLEARMWWVFVVAEYNLGCFDTISLKSSKSIWPITHLSRNITSPMKRIFKFKAMPPAQTLKGNDI